MKRVQRTIAITALLVSAAGALGACGNDDDKAREEGVFDDLTGTIDKAEEVEKKVMEQKERLDRAVEEAENPDKEKP